MRKSKLLVFSIPLMSILFILVAYRYGYMEVKAELASVKENEAARTKTLAQYMALFAGKPELEKQLAALKEIAKMQDSRIVEGKTPSIAAAALQESVKGMITARGGIISSERIVKPETLGKFMVVTVSMDMSVPDIRALADILYNIETQTPYLVVKELDARSKSFKDPKDLMVKLDVSALTRGK